MNIHRSTAELMEQNQAFVLATVIRAKGSVPGKTGFKMIVLPGGETRGTVGGGAIEKRVIGDAAEIAAGGESQVREYVLSSKAAGEDESGTVTILDMSCEGKVWIYFEVHGRKNNVYVFGGGHVGNKVLYFLKPLPFNSILIDNRREFASREANPDASQVVCSEYAEYARNFSPSENDMVVILTHGHKYDFDIVEIILKRKLTLKYIGVIGSKSKAKTMLEKIKEFSGQANRIFSPVGLPIGGDSAAEIALSIVAQIQAVQYDKIPENK